MNALSLADEASLLILVVHERAQVSLGPAQPVVLAPMVDMVGAYLTLVETPIDGRVLFEELFFDFAVCVRTLHAFDTVEAILAIVRVYLALLSLPMQDQLVVVGHCIVEVI